MIRLLAFALNVPADDHHGTLEFAKGMWDPDEAELWQKDLTGPVVHWIEVGQPEERRLVKASGRAERVSVYAFSHGAPAWWAGLSSARRARRQRRRVARAFRAEPGARLARATQHAAPGQPAGRHRLGRRRRPLGRDSPAPVVGRAAMSDPTASEADAVLDFWFGAPGSSEFGSARKAWFAKDEAFDAAIRERFGALDRARAARRARGLGRRAALGAGADPPPRPVHAQRLSRHARDRSRAMHVRSPRRAGWSDSRQDEALPPFMRGFVYLPFEHAEGLAMQDEAIRLFNTLVSEAPEQADMLDYAHRHREVIERFGRFPHRNEILGRQSTAEEIAFRQAARLGILSGPSARRDYGRRGLSGWRRPRSERRRGHGRRAPRLHGAGAIAR